ncbi:Histidine--tRNA ligase [bacterium HR40]|nr:Histidine--tRNA ligase [bacterium HR40]
MSRLRPVRGTHDLFGETLRRHRLVAETGRRLAVRYAFEEIETPIFEFTEVFSRTLGETSDVVTKEMYTFEDRGGDSITLRPENTASIVRAVISGGLFQDLPVKFFYCGPMFRYERPQKGRLRQFHQIGIEIIGAPEPEADVETIALGRHLLEELGVADRVELQINSLGNVASRAAYREALVAYLRRHEDRLSPDSRLRLERNPLRILDSKDPGDRELLAEAPLFSDYLDRESRHFFARVCAGLDLLDIPYRVEPKLVRGLDYYTHTTFEFVTQELGAQGAVIAGGRYDGLVKQMGGPDIAGIGWAGGVERLAMLLPAAPAAVRPTAVIPVGDEAEREAWLLAMELRRQGFVVDIAYHGRPSQRMKRADRRNCRFALSLGEIELARRVVRLRDLDTGEERVVSRDALAAMLRELGAAEA